MKAIAIHNAIISMNARKGFWKPKKSTDQKMFRMNCRPKMEIAVFTFLFCRPFCQTRKSAAPIRAKRMVQTGANSQFGGAKKGLFKEAYQVGMEGIVKNDSIMPANSHKRIAMASLEKSLKFIALRKEGSFFGVNLLIALPIC